MRSMPTPSAAPPAAPSACLGWCPAAVAGCWWSRSGGAAAGRSGCRRMLAIARCRSWWGDAVAAVAPVQPGADAAADRRTRGLADDRRRPVDADAGDARPARRARGEGDVLRGRRARAARPELVREIVRRGHGIGNHSATHPQALVLGAGAAAHARARSTRTQAIAAAKSPACAPRWFRAVVGMANPFVAGAAQARRPDARGVERARFRRGGRRSAARACARIERQLRPGRDRADARRRARTAATSRRWRCCCSGWTRWATARVLPEELRSRRSLAERSALDGRARPR